MVIDSGFCRRYYYLDTMKIIRCNHLLTGGTLPLPGAAPRPAAWACREGTGIVRINICISDCSARNHGSISFYDWIQREEILLWLSWQQHGLFLLQELNPCPAKGNNTMCKQRFIIRNNQDYRWAKIEYLDSGLQTFEHWSILKHIWDHHEPEEILALIIFNLFQS